MARSAGTITVAQARAFVTVATTQSYDGARKRLGLEDAAAVRHLVGRFTRSVGRGALVAPDHAGGLALTSRGREVLPAAETLVEAAIALDSAPLTVAVGTYPSIAQQIVETLAGQDPTFTFVDVSEANRADGGLHLIDSLLAGEIDIAIGPTGGAVGRTMPKQPGIATRRLYDWHLRAIYPKGEHAAWLAAGQNQLAEVTLDDLVAYGLLACPRGHLSRTLLDTAYRATGRTGATPVIMETEDQNLLHSMARNSATYVAIIPDDAFGRVDEHLGPILTSGDQRLGGSYALYHMRTHRSGERLPAQLEAEIARVADDLVDLLAATRRK